MLDADIYGPSVPRMLGLTENVRVRRRPEFLPIEKYGLKLMSIGFLVNENSPMIWRGPMVMRR